MREAVVVDGVGGSAFCVSHDDHMRFVMLYGAVHPPLRRVFAGVAALVIVIAFGAALPATWGLVSFLTIKRSATPRIPPAWVFSIYVVFMVSPPSPRSAGACGVCSRAIRTPSPHPVVVP